jgi:hypothetical protein
MRAPTMKLLEARLRAIRERKYRRRPQRPTVPGVPAACILCGQGTMRRLTKADGICKRHEGG